jgi:hyperosmotically inducible protein
MQRSLRAILGLLLVAGTVGCNRAANNADVEEQINRSLEAAGLRDVSADQDADKGVVTLTGEVLDEGQKARAEEIAKAEAGGQIVANEISVRPVGLEGQMQETQSALDDGIENNYEAELVKNNLEAVSYDSREGVITLTGSVDTPAQRQLAEKLATSVPNVKQVVNMIEVGGEPRPATTTTR